MYIYIYIHNTIYTPLKMVIFHSCVNVYHRLHTYTFTYTYLYTSTVVPNQCFQPDPEYSPSTFIRSQQGRSSWRGAKDCFSLSIQNGKMWVFTKMGIDGTFTILKREYMEFLTI